MKINDILFEFAPPGSGDSGDDGFSEETLKRLASQWYNGNEDPRIEKALMAAGWEIGQDEGYDDEPGVFVVQSGDVNGNSYISWPAHELKQGVAEGYSLGKVLSLPELLGQIKHILTAKHRGIGWKMKMHGDNTFVFSAQNDYDVWSMLVVEAGGDDWVSVGHGMVDPDGKPIIFDRQQLPMTLASASEIADEAIQTYHDIDLSDYADDDEYNQGVAEGAGNIGRQIKAVYKKIYDQGDDAVEFAYYDSPIFAQYWDEYEGDLDSIIAEVDPSELQIILDELTSAAEDQGLAEGLNEFVLPGGGGDNYGGDLHDILMAYISRNEPELLADFGEDDIDSVVADMVTMGMFDDIDPNNEEDLEDALDKIIDILTDDLLEQQGVAEGERGLGRPTTGTWDPTSGKVGRVEKTSTGIRHHADPSRYGGTEPDDEDDRLLSKAQIHRLDKATEPEVDEGKPSKPEQPEADYGDDYQAMVSRVKKLAGLGPLKTVYDPQKRVYKNVPVAVQPKK